MKPSAVAAFVVAQFLAQNVMAQDAAAPAAQDPAAAPAAADGAAPAAAPAKKDDAVYKIKRYLLARPKDQPSRLERLLVASGASAIAVVGLGVGVGFGLWALDDYLCLRDVSACKDRPVGGRTVEGTDFLKARSEGERKALVADMGYLMAVTFAGVAALGFASAFWPSGWWPFQNEEVLDTEQPAAAPASGGAK